MPSSPLSALECVHDHKEDPVTFSGHPTPSFPGPPPPSSPKQPWIYLLSTHISSFWTWYNGHMWSFVTAFKHVRQKGHIIFVSGVQHNWFNVYIYGHATTRRLVNPITNTLTHFFLVMRTLKIYSLSNFQICNPLLTVVTTLDIRRLWLLYSITGSYFNPLPHAHPPIPTSSPHKCILCL